MRSLRLIFRSALLVLLAGGCGGLYDPVHRPSAGSVSSGHGKDASARPADSGARNYVTVAPGDTVTALARRYGVGARDIIEVNGLTPPYMLRVGQLIRLPAPGLYRVRAGESLTGIARRFDIDPERLAGLNGLDPPWRLRPGQLLAVPRSARPVAAVPLPLLRDAARRPETREPETGVQGLLPAWLTDLIAGMQPDAETGSSGTPDSDAPGVPAPARDSGPAAHAAAPPPAAGWEQAERPAGPKVPPRSGLGFLWPVRGPVISAFGPNSDGLHNDGINIAAPRGSPVLAAENGVIAYVGRDLAGYGTLVLVSHAGGWVTAYAHVARVLVRQGDVVQRGATIATIGDSGGVLRPQLHFEVRRGTTAVDPRLHLET